MALITSTINIPTIYRNCETLSSYVAREQNDANGNTMYEQIHIQTRDTFLLTQYAVEAMISIGKVLLPFGEFQYDEQATPEQLKFQFTNTYNVPSGFDNLLLNYIIDWVMGAWLLDKVPERAAYFKTEAERLAEKIPTMIFRTKPTI